MVFERVSMTLHRIETDINLEAAIQRLSLMDVQDLSLLLPSYTLSKISLEWRRERM